METQTGLIAPLLDSVKEYSTTSFELLKLRSFNKTADVVSTLTSRLFLAMILAIFSITLTIAVALWLGDLTGKNYYGFLIVTAIYGIIGITIYFMHPVIKARVNDSVITVLSN